MSEILMNELHSKLHLEEELAVKDSSGENCKRYTRSVSLFVTKMSGNEHYFGRNRIIHAFGSFKFKRYSHEEKTHVWICIVGFQCAFSTMTNLMISCAC